MARRSLLGALLLLPLLGLYLLPTRAERKPTEAPAPSASEAPSLPRRALAPASVAAPSRQSQYRLSYEQEVTVDSKPHTSVKMAGLWMVTPSGTSSAEASLRLDRLDWVGGEVPSREQMGLPISLSLADGRLLGVGFSEATPAAARGALTELAAAFQCAQGTGVTWTTEEEDRLGRYTATYRRTAENKISRKRTYTAIRGAGGLSAQGLELLSVEESSTFEHDSDGLVRANVRLTHRIRPPKAPPIQAVLVASLERDRVVEVAPPSLAPSAEPLATHVDHQALGRKQDEALVAGASRAQIIAEATQAARVGRETPGAQKAKSVALRRLAALARIDPEAPAALADVIRRSPEDEAVVSQLAGALSSARSPAATNALASLLTGPLPEGARHSVLTGLALTETPTNDSVTTLSRSLDQPLGGRAALALGSQISAMEGSPGAEDALDLLIDRFRAARTPEERMTYLEALINAGNERVFPILVEVIQGDDLALSRAAVYGLRRIPGDAADDLLERLLWTAPSLALDTIKAIAYRSPERWRPKLEKAAEVYAGIKQLADAIQTVLARWTPMPTEDSEGNDESD